MLPRRNRVKTPLFKPLFKQGRVFHGANLSLRWYIDPKPLVNPRFSIVVSSKVANTAVLRNRLKRQGKAVLLPLLSRIKSGTVGVIFFKQGAANLKSGQLAEEIALLLKQARVL